jgi:hypothetical protein
MNFSLRTTSSFIAAQTFLNIIIKGLVSHYGNAVFCYCFDSPKINI